MDVMKTAPRRTLPLLALLLGACVPLSTEPMPDIPQTPEYETVRVEYGTSDQLGAGGLAFRASVGEMSNVALFTRQTVARTNLILYQHLTTLQDLRRQRPTEHSDDEWIWEVTLGGNYHHFRIERVGDDELLYTLRVGTSADDNAPVLWGEMETLAGTAGSVQQATGRVTIDLTALGAYDPTVANGEVYLAFRSFGGVRQVRVGFEDYQDRDMPEPLSGIYEYTQLPDATGFFTFFIIDAIGVEQEPRFLSVDAAWTAEQAGRAEAIYANLEGSVDLTAQKCWGDDQRVSYARTQPSLPTLEGGEVSDCAEALQPLELQAPRPDEIQGTVPELPGPHPDESSG